MATELWIRPFGDTNDPRWRVERLEDGIRSFLAYGLTSEKEAEQVAEDAALWMGADLKTYPLPIRNGARGWRLVSRF